MRYLGFIAILIVQGLWAELDAQNRIGFKGQFSTAANYSPDNEMDLFIGGRYIPQLEYSYRIDSANLLDFEASANMSASAFLRSFDSSSNTSTLNPYRLWARYSTRRSEFRIGLQKIDFGSASLLRPIQWFNQIDPRDPLQLTNGVYAALYRHYLKNNANIWLWALYGNEKTRGFDVVNTNEQIPEYGGRVQLPLQQGEIAMSYHHRVADSRGQMFLPEISKIPEDRIGIDGKWDVGVGLWFESSYVHKHESILNFTEQAMLNLGADYTFSVGNGLNMMVEHLAVSFDSTAFAFEQTAHVTALMANYPLALFDQIMLLTYYNWSTESPILLLNYQHQFKHISGYVLAYYNPESTQGIQENDLVNSFQGPGIRIMLVYNH
ncbi:MAG: hypothetical protein JXR19_00230 [Bacteroidia bacterium]